MDPRDAVSLNLINCSTVDECCWQQVATIDVPWRNYLSPELVQSSRGKYPNFWDIFEFPRSSLEQAAKKTSVQNISWDCSAVSIELRLVTDTHRYTHWRTQAYNSTALGQRHADRNQTWNWSRPASDYMYNTTTDLRWFLIIMYN